MAGKGGKESKSARPVAASRSGRGRQPVVSIPEIDPLIINEMVDLAEARDLTEINLGWKGYRIRIRRRGPGVYVSDPISAQAHPSGPAAAAGPVPAAPGPPHNANLTPVATPLTGVFYRAPRPGAASFVSVDDVVKPGQTLCIIEAMKLMNEISAEMGGRVAEILVENGRVVETGQILFLIEPQ